MKAVCLLLCLALARHSAGSIFHRRHYPSMERLVAESADYIQPIQRAPMFMFQAEPRRQELRQDTPVYEQTYNQQKQEADREQAYYINQNQAKNHEEQVTNQKRLVYQQNPTKRYAEPSFLETVSHEAMLAPDAQRALDVQLYDQKFADLNTPYVYANRNLMPELYGDAVAWRGLEFASGPNFSIEKDDIKNIYQSAQLATKHIQPETKAKLHEAVEVETYTKKAKLNATELLQKYQYPVEEHTIRTEDGYYLTLFRIPPLQQSEDKPRKVVFLMHGLLGSADDWLLRGPKKSLAFQLADAGYDVFLGNARGNKYTRHASKNRALPDFWQYSNDEVALFDLPAMIDYALKVSKQQKMFYIGHSQGTTAFFALVAARPEYNDKIEAMYALSPMVYMSNVRSPVVRMMAPTSPLYEHLSSQLGNGEFMPSKEVVHTMGGGMCENEIGCKHMCSNVYFVMAGVNVQNMDPKDIPSIMDHLPAGGSTKLMYQYAYAYASQEFSMYNYGPDMNMKVYGQRHAPKYNLEKVTVPVVLYYSEHDWLAHPNDVERLRTELPNATSYKIPQDYFSHVDFQYSKQAPEMVNRNLIESIQKEQYNNYKQENKQQWEQL